MRKCSLASVNSVFAEIAKAAALYIPADRTDGSAVYTKWEEGVEWSKALNTVRSPKDFFFPQMENLMEFKTSGKTIEVIDTRSETEDFVVFGVRACDVKSFDILDKVFLTEPRDSYYASRREKGIIVSTACSKPSETCFCKTFGVSPEEPAGDITTWKTESEVFFKVILLQVIKRILAPMSNEVITLVKDTALARVIMIVEIIQAAQNFAAYGLMWPLFYTAVFYLIFVGLLTIIFSMIEKKLAYYKV